MRRSRFRPPVDLGRSAFSGFRFPPEVITLAVRCNARLGSRRGLKAERAATVGITGHAVMQNLRRGHNDFGVEAEPRLRIAVVADELTEAM